MSRWRVVAVVLGGLVAFWGSGCQAGASLRENRGLAPGLGGKELTGGRAWFKTGAKGRQVIILALDEVPRAPADGPEINEPAAAQPGVPPGAAAQMGAPLGATAPLRYRVYVQLVVQSGGGDFEIGDREWGGQVFAHYYLYTARDRKPDIYPALRGSRIVTRAWPLAGGWSVDTWDTSGEYDLWLSNDVQIGGSFRAVHDPTTVDRFLKDKRL